MSILIPLIRHSGLHTVRSESSTLQYNIFLQNRRLIYRSYRQFLWNVYWITFMLFLNLDPKLVSRRNKKYLKIKKSLSKNILKKSLKIACRKSKMRKKKME
jgi:hypothetical protein